MPVSPAFKKHYRRLNAEQKRAVDTIEGPVMVIAGPGTGKTQILTLRIANILRLTDASPDSVLALTFTEAGVIAMRRRLVEIMGSDAYRVGIYTFHSFANDLISRFPDYYPRIIGARSINDIDKITILKEIISATKLPLLRPFGAPFHYLSHIRAAISELKRENISPAEAKRIVSRERKALLSTDDLYHTSGPYKGKMKGKYVLEEKRLEKNAELARLYERYEEALKERHLYDYEDMIVETIRALLSHPDFLLTLQESYQYLLADEHQDANNSQNKLLELLSSFHTSPNLFLVGDEKQAIYRFQGASLENFLYFSKRFPDAAVIRLSENYRSRQSILDAAHSLIREGPLSEHEDEKPLRSQMKEKASAVHVRVFSRPEFEYAYLAADLRRLIDEGVEPHQIAVLYRNNGDVEAIVPALERERVPYTIESDQNVLADPDIRKLILLLYAVHFFGSDERLVPVLHLDFLALPPLDLYKLFRARLRDKVTLYELLGSPARLRRAGVRKTAPLRALYGRLASWSSYAKNRGLLETLELIAKESGFWGHIVAHERAQEKLDKYAGFIRDIEGLVEAHREYTLADLVRYLDLLTEHDLLIKRSRRYVRTPSVRLMTAHRSKGLEFDHVYLPDTVLGHWGGARAIRHFSLTEEMRGEAHDPLSDERRLFYVALTRARHGVTMLYAREGRDGKQTLPSQFLEEIDPKLFLETSEERFESKESPQKLLAPRPPVLLPVTEARYLRELFLEQGLSVTALNNYLRDPWEYFFGNLLRVPTAPNRSMLFGTAVHGALNDFFNRIGEGKEAEKAHLLSRFRHHLERLPLSERDYTTALEKGEYALSGYHDAYAAEFKPTLGNEFSIAVELPLAGEKITLRGVLDKIELVSGGEVCVTDYKTGPIRSRNEILGKTKTSRGEYFRQLVFYKLLLSRYEKGRYRMTSGVVDFIEPDARGRYRRERFAVTDEDVVALLKEIERVAKEILELRFWSEPCDSKSSDFCALREMLVEPRGVGPRKKSFR